MTDQERLRAISARLLEEARDRPTGDDDGWWWRFCACGCRLGVRGSIMCDACLRLAASALARAGEDGGKPA